MKDTESHAAAFDPDVEPMEKLDELCERLKEYNPTVHRPDDPDPEYNYLEPGCACVTLDNPFREWPMFIDLEGEFSLTYGNWHSHYFGSESEYQCLLKDIDNILTNRACAATLFTGTEKKWLGSRLITKDQLERLQVQEVFEYVLKYPEFKKRLQDNGGIAEFRFWNIIDDTDIIIEPSSH